MFLTIQFQLFIYREQIRVVFKGPHHLWSIMKRKHI
jgi:hypothetical protein